MDFFRPSFALPQQSKKRARTEVEQAAAVEQLALRFAEGRDLWTGNLLAGRDSRQHNLVIFGGGEDVLRCRHCRRTAQSIEHASRWVICDDETTGICEKCQKKAAYAAA